MAERYQRLRELGRELHVAETGVHDSKLAKREAINRLKEARGAGMGEAIIPYQGEYMLCRDGLRQARARRTEARRALEVYKGVNGIRKVVRPSFQADGLVEMRASWE
jgi:hypothetical protein